MGYCSHPAKKRRAVNNNTLRDAQKRQKTPFRRETRDFRAKCARKHLAEHNRVNSNRNGPGPARTLIVSIRQVRQKSLA